MMQRALNAVVVPASPHCSTRQAAAGRAPIAPPPSVCQVGPAFRGQAVKADRISTRAVGNTSSAVYEAAAPPGDDPLALKKMLMEQGWSSSWVEGIFVEAKKRSFYVSLSGAQAVMEKLAAQGLDKRSIENMCSKVPGILGREVAAIQSVIDYLQAQGATAEETKSLLLKNPRMLVFDVTADGNQLASDKARMELDITTEGNKRLPVVSVFREDAAFETAPVSPWKPRHQK